MNNIIKGYFESKGTFFWISFAMGIYTAFIFTLNNMDNFDAVFANVVAFVYILLMALAGDSAPIKINKKTRVFKTHLYIDLNRIIFIDFGFVLQVLLTVATILFYYNLYLNISALVFSGFEIFCVGNYYVNVDRMKKRAKRHQHHHHHHHHSSDTKEN